MRLMYVSTPFALLACLFCGFARHDSARVRSRRNPEQVVGENDTEIIETARNISEHVASEVEEEPPSKMALSMQLTRLEGSEKARVFGTGELQVNIVDKIDGLVLAIMPAENFEQEEAMLVGLIAGRYPEDRGGKLVDRPATPMIEKQMEDGRMHKIRLDSKDFTWEATQWTLIAPDTLKFRHGVSDILSMRATTIGDVLNDPSQTHSIMAYTYWNPGSITAA